MFFCDLVAEEDLPSSLLGIKLRLLAVQLVLQDQVECMLNSAVQLEGVSLTEQVSPLGV